ncbi:histone-lysine N-methyltransferase SETMAR [Trichonephila clavipes]|nr:histone-lysine N-methyltransferase SETMAR [Trichonephila clavipes]
MNTSKVSLNQYRGVWQRRYPAIAAALPTNSDRNHTSQNCQVIYSQFGLAIHQNDHQARRRFVEWAQNEIAVAPDFHKRILFSDEAHFWLNGYINKQNCRIWSEANPQVYVETPLHPEKLTVWCALWAGGIIGPYFFKNDEGHNVTVNGDRYRAMITHFFIPELNNHDIQELWFRQDGATCHTARARIDLLKDPLVYADKPQTLDLLEDNIRRVITDIRPQMLEKVIENWTSRLDYIRASRGSHMPEIIFKISHSVVCKHLCAVFGKDIVNVRTCQRWFRKFRSGDLSLQESDHSGRPSKIDNDVFRSMLENNPHLTSQEIAEEFGIHHTTVGDHIKSLGNIISDSSKTKYSSMKSTALFVVGQERSSVPRFAVTGGNHQHGSVLQSTG